MSTIGHLFVGAAAARYTLSSPSRQRRLLFATLIIALAIAPDLDLALFATLGVPESLTAGHRGATHSLFVALVAAGFAALLARALRVAWRPVAIGAFVAIGSHAVLDSLTPGPGVAWLWPFTDTRFPTFPVLPIATLEHPFSLEWIVRLVAETVVFLPFLAYAVVGRRLRAGTSSASVSQHDRPPA